MAFILCQGVPKNIFLAVYFPIYTLITAKMC